MKSARSPSQFSDVASVLDAALSAGGGLYRLQTPGKAIRWRQRAYSLRSLLLKLDADRKGGLVPPSSPYDTMVLRIHEVDPCVVRIETLQPEGELTSLTDQPLRPQQSINLVDDPLLDEVEALVGKIGL